MDGLKIFGKTEREINVVVTTVWVFEIELGTKMCCILIIQRSKSCRLMMQNYPRARKSEDIETNDYKYLRILEYDKIKINEIMERFRREYLRRTKLVGGIRLNGEKKAN